jgi:hypothetical protein
MVGIGALRLSANVCISIRVVLFYLYNIFAMCNIR